jgi:hypothetical protein
MTREDAKYELMDKTVHGRNYENTFVNKIYDYFESTIEELQQRLDNLQADYDDCIVTPATDDLDSVMTEMANREAHAGLIRAFPACAIADIRDDSADQMARMLFDSMANSPIIPPMFIPKEEIVEENMFQKFRHLMSKEMILVKNPMPIVAVKVD